MDITPKQQAIDHYETEIHSLRGRLASIKKDTPTHKRLSRQLKQSVKKLVKVVVNN
jgi:hypothetical protein